MSLPPVNDGGSAADTETGAHFGLRKQLRHFAQALRTPRVGKAILLLAAAIVLVVLATAYGQIRLNRWNEPFYDALSRRDFSDFMLQLGVFGVIAASLLVLNVAQRWLVETLKIRLREGLVQNLVGLWMKPLRAFWLTHTGSIGVNPDQRMHEDARKLCELSADLAVGLLQATVLFVIFGEVLWRLSADFSIWIDGRDYAAPGFMLWAAIIYAVAGSLLSYWVGRSLISRNAERYAREADLRFSMVRINEHLDGISLAAGEADEKRRVEIDLAEVLRATGRLVMSLTNLTWVTAGFGWITTVAPVLVAAPLYFSGKISFGGLMMSAAAFTQAQSSLRWFVDNFSAIADWRATLWRVTVFRRALIAGDTPHDFASRIAYADGNAGELRIDELEIESPSGRDALSDPHLVVHAGERVLIDGAPGASKTLLFHALAGLWPWGSGRVTRPGGETLAYMPRGTPYLPHGSLREILAYPQDVSSFAEATYGRALHRLGLDRLTPLLDLRRRWDHELSHDEQLSIAFARLLLQRPAWLLIDDTISSLEIDALARVIGILGEELQSTGVVYIGRPIPGYETLFSRSLHLLRIAGAVEVPPQDAEPGP